MAATPNAPKKSRNIGVIAIVLLLVGGFCSIMCVGILAAVAIPSFIDYMRRAKTSEARSNLSTIAAHMESYRAEHGTYPSAPPTPAAPPCATREIFPADPSWAQIGFSPLDPIYYSYEAQGTSEGYVIRARGDLDCDGVVSLFERSSDSAVVRTENEME